MNELEGHSVAAAHELKTPLVLIRQLSLQLERTDDITIQKEIIRRIQLTAERSLRLVDTMTKAARLEDAIFEMEPIQVSGLCKDVIHELTPLADARGQELIVTSSRRPLVAVGNRELLKSLLIGLVDNAIQHSDSGSKIEFGNGISNREAIISVRDYGSVVDLSDFRALKDSIGHRALPISARPLSSGLGLLIAQKLLEAMDGSLSVRRHCSGGMTFSAHLPLSRQLSLLEF